MFYEWHTTDTSVYVVYTRQTFDFRISRKSWKKCFLIVGHDNFYEYYLPATDITICVVKLFKNSRISEAKASEILEILNKHVLVIYWSL